MAGPVLRRSTDRGNHVLFRHREPSGSGHDDRHPVGARVHGFTCDRVDQSSLHGSGSYRQRAASTRDRGFRARLDRNALPVLPPFVGRDHQIQR